MPSVLNHPVMTRMHEIAINHPHLWPEVDYTRSLYAKVSETIADCPYLGRLYAVTFPRPSAESVEVIRSILGALTALRF